MQFVQSYCFRLFDYLQGLKGGKSNKRVFGSHRMTAMANDFNMATNEIIYLATPIDANDARNKS